MSLAVKYRPQTFNDVVGQNITVEILKRQIQNKNIKNAILFAGTSGCGKTTCARLFAKAINNGIGDPIEIDGASNNGVDNVRAIIESANERSLTGEYKVFIIDECHSLTTQAWQAFLKGIEETPKYTIFIFCTTEPQKVPETILNRVQRFNFAPIDQNEIKTRLLNICKNEGFANYEQVCDLISKMSNGGMRNAINYLEQVADYSHNLSLEVTKHILSGISFETMFKLTWAIKDNKEEDIFSIVDSLYNNGQDLKYFIDCYLNFVLDLTKYILFKNIEITSIPRYLATEENAVVQFTVNFENSLAIFMFIADKLVEIKSQIKFDQNYKSTILVLLLTIAREISGGNK